MENILHKTSRLETLGTEVQVVEDLLINETLQVRLPTNMSYFGNLYVSLMSTRSLILCLYTIPSQTLI